MSYRILSIDGGGVRGVLVTRLLERLTALVPGWLEQVDLFAGSSTGGIVALGLSAGFSPEELTHFYRDEAVNIFADTAWDNIWDLGNLLGAQYQNDALGKAIIDRVGEMRLGDLPKKVLIPTFDLDNEGESLPRRWKAKFYHNYAGKDSDENERVSDVVLRTTAAPTLFPVYQGYIDGGAVANNPSTCALAQALHLETGRQSLEEIAILSLGTGLVPRYLPTKNGDWGLIQWAPKLVDLLLEAGEGLADYQCRQILQKRYYRLNPTLPEPIDSDAVSHIPQLISLADSHDLATAESWLKRYFL